MFKYLSFPQPSSITSFTLKGPEKYCDYFLFPLFSPSHQTGTTLMFLQDPKGGADPHVCHPVTMVATLLNGLAFHQGFLAGLGCHTKSHFTEASNDNKSSMSNLERLPPLVPFNSSFVLFLSCGFDPEVQKESPSQGGKSPLFLDSKVDVTLVTWSFRMMAASDWGSGIILEEKFL